MWENKGVLNSEDRNIVFAKVHDTRDKQHQVK